MWFPKLFTSKRTFWTLKGVFKLFLLLDLEYQVLKRSISFCFIVSLIHSFTVLSYSSLLFLWQKGEMVHWFYWFCGYLLHALLASISLYLDWIEFMSFIYFPHIVLPRYLVSWCVQVTSMFKFIILRCTMVSAYMI